MSERRFLFDKRAFADFRKFSIAAITNVAKRLNASTKRPPCSRVNSMNWRAPRNVKSSKLQSSIRSADATNVIFLIIIKTKVKTYFIVSKV